MGRERVLNAVVCLNLSISLKRKLRSKALLVDGEGRGGRLLASALIKASVLALQIGLAV